MALVPNFSTSESLSVLSQVTFLDISTGSDGGLTSRRIAVRLANGNWLDTNGESSTIVYIPWAIANASVAVNILTSSTVASVTVDWLTGAVVTYTKTLLQEWDLYDYLFAFGLLQDQTASPSIVQDANYYGNFFMFLTNLWNSENAVTVGNDIYSSQSALNKNLFLIQNEGDFF